MIWKKDKLKPVQPYWVIDNMDYVQRLSSDDNISHFYCFTSKGEGRLRIVPGGCVDLLFVYNNGNLKLHVCGTQLRYSEVNLFAGSKVFGVRFMPGVMPEMIDVKIGELTERILEYDNVKVGEDDFLDKMAATTDFESQIRIFEEAYKDITSEEKEVIGKAKIVKATRELIYSSDGKVKISEIEEKTGYSEMYINKVFSDEMGFSPKTFCKIIQFQRALEYLDYGAPGKMTDASVKLGFYDQSQFIKDFKKYAGITPKKYLDMVENIDYKNLMKHSVV